MACVVFTLLAALFQVAHCAGYIDGIGPASIAPRFVTSWGVKILGSYLLRRSATGLGFVDKQKFSTEDAVRIGRIHTYDRGWEAAKLAFIASGGYKSISKQVITAPVLMHDPL